MVKTSPKEQPQAIKAITHDEFDFLVGTRPWVVGDKFIGPAISDLLLAYYITQGEQPQRAKEFAQLHLAALRERVVVLAQTSNKKETK